MPIAPIDEVTSVDYLVAGEAQAGVPDLVLIHGTGGSAESNWLHLIDGLRAGRRAIAPNFAGSGETKDHGGRLELSELVAQVAGAAEHAGSELYDVVGFSLGAVVAAQLAAEHPERVRRLVLIAGWASSEDGRVQLQFDLWRRLNGTDPEGLAQLLTLTGFSPGFLSKRPAKVVRRMVEDNLATLPAGIGRQSELDQRIDLTDTLPLIKASTLVIGCKEDQMVPVQHPRGLVAPIRWSDYHEIDSGHLVIYEQPGPLTDTITGFLARPDRREDPSPQRDGPERRRR
jgi:pimeloyl-ACP methyl ester carboxylesterase